MATVPDEFHKEFDKKGDTFFEIAELLYTQPDREFTQDKLAEKVGRSNTTISKHTSMMEKEDWINRQDNQTTFTWNVETHNPARTEGVAAVKMFYMDFLDLLKKHSNTVPGSFAIVGFALILTAIVMFAFFVGLSLKTSVSSGVPNGVYFAIAVGSFLTGVIVTSLSPLQAHLTQLVLRYFPKSLLRK
ncbi:MarR family transcriptional regulator [Natronosalvus vescus]|uniref:MarR family transcriptional regulator n=1 Tax=Natronosalvus vescus TaxID=2953881 RepID=UPI002090898A|nr:MarR family transcriptional regulator [Natronosalvus vescus]